MVVLAGNAGPSACVFIDSARQKAGALIFGCFAQDDAVFSFPLRLVVVLLGESRSFDSLLD